MIKPWVFEFFPAPREPGATEDPQQSADYFNWYLDLWPRAEPLGYEGIFFSEHHFGLAYSPCPNLLIAQVAARTRTIRLGVMGVVLPYHQPWKVVEEIGMLDHLTQGRLEIGTAAGIPQEMAQVGLSVAEARERNDEAIEIMDAALAAPVISHHGKYWSFIDLRLVPRPLQRPHPPIWVTVISEDSARKAARRGAKICTGFHPTQRVKSIFDAYRDEASRVGTPSGPDQFALRRQISIGTDDAATRAAARVREQVTRSRLLAERRARLDQPFRGITTDGDVIPDLYTLADEGAPTAGMVEAARAVLNVASDEERARLCHAIDAPQWRMWSNPELYFDRFGLRLDELRAPLREAILAVLRASMSPKGFAKARGAMRTNGFLGELVNAPRVMNEYSYNFSLFGEPSTTQPWGWSLFGHHLCLNCFVLKNQMVLSPDFIGAEPNCIDCGPYAGLELFQDEERIGLELMHALPQPLQRHARVYELMHDPAMPEGRWHPADQRHLGGAYRDNWVIPYEGVPVRDFPAAPRDRLLGLAAAYFDILPAGPFAARMRQIEDHIDATYFCWIGGYGDDDPFYYRIQSPVAMIEFDHHSGVFLTNTEPAKCHIHTVIRTPNGNDYGKDLLRQHYARVHGVPAPGRA